MSNVYFEDCLRYDDYIKRKYNGLNISDLLFANTLRREDLYGKYNPIFDLNDFINVDELICINPCGTDKYKVFFHPDVEKLRENFRHPNRTPREYDLKKSAKLIENFKYDLQVLKIEILNFIRERDEVLSFKDISLISPLNKEVNKELQKVLFILQKTLPQKKIVVNDYYFDHAIEKSEKDIKFNYFYNYKAFRDFLKEYCLSDSEFYNKAHGLERAKKQKIELEEELNTEEDPIVYAGIEYEIEQCKAYIYEMENRLNFINLSPVFNKETLSLICLKLEKFIERENLIDEFLIKIRDNKLSTLEIDENQIMIHHNN